MTHQQHAHILSHSHTHSQPSSPISTKFKHYVSHIGIDPTHIVPIDDPIRTTPIHPSIPSIKVPDPSIAPSAVASTANAGDDNIHSNNAADVNAGLTLNPLTLKPFTSDDLKHHNYHALRTQYAHSPEGAARARDEAVAEIKARLEEADRRTREVEREMEEKEKTREIERKVWAKRRGAAGGVGAAGGEGGVGSSGAGG